MINAELFVCDEKLSMETKHTSTKTTENVNISPKWDKHYFKTEEKTTVI